MKMTRVGTEYHPVNAANVLPTELTRLAHIVKSNANNYYQ